MKSIEVNKKSSASLKNAELRLKESGRQDSNLRLLGPKPSALAKLSYTPCIDVLPILGQNGNLDLEGI